MPKNSRVYSDINEGPKDNEDVIDLQAYAPRYKPGEHAVYDQVKNRLKHESVIFHPEKAPIGHAYVPDIIRDKRGVKKLIEEWRPKLNYAKGKVDFIDLRFSDLKKRAINTGHRAPEKMPADLFEEHLKAQARYDAIAEEIVHLKKILSGFVEVEQKQDDSAVLKYGPVGMSKVRNNKICEIDGQHVRRKGDGNNLFVIADSRSPYDGMYVADYFELIVKPWIQSQGRHSHQVKQYKLRKAKATEAGQPFSEKHPVPPKWPEPVMP